MSEFELIRLMQSWSVDLDFCIVHAVTTSMHFSSSLYGPRGRVTSASCVGELRPNLSHPKHETPCSLVTVPTQIPNP